MEEKHKLYNIVYENLKCQILSGQREYGSTLPSAHRLSEVYQVGIRTIKTALNELKKDGLICTSERRKAAVTYKAPFIERENSSIKEITRRQSSILAIYETMEIIIPDILVFCSRFSYLYELNHYDYAVKWVRKPKHRSSWKAISLLLHDYMNASGNFLFSSIHSALELYAEIPFLMEYQDSITSYSPYIEELDTGEVLKCLKNHDRYTLMLDLKKLFHAVSLSMYKSFERLKAVFPDAEDDRTQHFKWTFYSDRYPYYMQIAYDILSKIGFKIYPAGTLLPSENKLAAQYGVSVWTIRKALEFLNEAEFAKTYNGIGTKVIRPANIIYEGKGNKKDKLLYLCALQLMTVIIRPVAGNVFDRIALMGQAGFLQLFNSKEDTLSKLLNCIIEEISLYPLKVILSETNKFINMGFYYSFYNFDSLSSIIKRILNCLKAGNQSGFETGLFDCYCRIFKNMRQLLIDEGIDEAKNMMTPE